MDLSGVEMGNLQVSQMFAPADFPDVETVDNRPMNTLSNTVANLVVYHVSDTTEKLHQSRVWRRKIRDLLQNHQEKILDFFTKPMPNEHPLRSAHILLTKYGKLHPSLTVDLSKSPPVFLRDCIVDISSNGIQSLNAYIEGLMATRANETPITRWLSVTRNMLDYMRDVGDELIRIDQKLRDQCAHVDSVVEKIMNLVNLPSPGLDGFQEMMEAYIQKQFETYPIHTTYWDYIYTLQKYTALRDILIPQRSSSIPEPICCICMTEPTVIAMIPCGHTFCSNCSKRTIVCHICRQMVTGRLRIYFG
jgi:hypothetical protein